MIQNHLAKQEQSCGHSQKLLFVLARNQELPARAEACKPVTPHLSAQTLTLLPLTHADRLDQKPFHTWQYCR